MHLMMKSCRGVSFLVWLHADRIVMSGAVVAALLVGAFVGTTLIRP